MAGLWTSDDSPCAHAVLMLMTLFTHVLMLMTLLSALLMASVYTVDDIDGIVADTIDSIDHQSVTINVV